MREHYEQQEKEQLESSIEDAKELIKNNTKKLWETKTEGHIEYIFVAGKWRISHIEYPNGSEYWHDYDNKGNVIFIIYSDGIELNDIGKVLVLNNGIKIIFLYSWKIYEYCI